MNLLQFKVPNKIKSILKLQPTYVICFLLICFSDFWVYHAKPIIPLYYFYLFSLLYIPVFLLHQKILVFSKAQIFSLICTLYTFSVFLYGNNDWQYLIHTGTAISCFIIATMYLRNINVKKIFSISKWLLLLTSFYISLETYWRLSHPLLSREENLSDIESGSFYIYKINSFMISDSNAIGLMTLVLLFFAFYMYKYVNKSKFYKFMIFIFAILTILSISRAAIIAMIISYGAIKAVDIIKKSIKIYKIKQKLTINSIILLLAFPIFLILFSIILIKLFQDASFGTKISLITDTINFVNKVPLEKFLFGVGTSLDVANHLFGRYPHNIVLTYLSWFGLIGTTLIYLYWYQIIKETNFKGILVLLPQILAGISYTFPGLHLFYCTIALMWAFEKNKGLNN